MKKKNMLVILVLLTGILTARSQSTSTTIVYKDKMQPALVIELANSTDDVDGTILKKLKQAGYNPETQGHLFWKKHKTGGFYVFEKISLPTISSSKLDMYFKVAQKNNQEKNNSTLYLLVSSGNENFASPDRDTLLWDNARIFLNGFTEMSTAYTLEKDITNQETTLTNSQKKLTTLQKDERDLADKIKKYQDDLLNNKSDQVNQQLDIETQAKLLADLKLKRKV